MSTPSVADPAPSLAWSVEMPLVTNRFFLYDLAKVIAWTGTVMLALMALIMGANGSIREFPTVAGIVGLILLGFAGMALLISLVFFGNRYPTQFAVGPMGVAWTGLSRRARFSNRAAIVAGALTLSAGTAGAGLLAAANESGLEDWGGFARIRKYPEHRVITLMNGWRVVIRLYCTPDNYDYVASLVDWYRAQAPVR